MNTSNMINCRDFYNMVASTIEIYEQKPIKVEETEVPIFDTNKVNKRLTIADEEEVLGIHTSVVKKVIKVNKRDTLFIEQEGSFAWQISLMLSVHAAIKKYPYLQDVLSELREFGVLEEYDKKQFLIILRDVAKYYFEPEQRTLILSEIINRF